MPSDIKELKKGANGSVDLTCLGWRWERFVRKISQGFTAAGNSLDFFHYCSSANNRRFKKEEKVWRRFREKQNFYINTDVR